MPNVAVFIPVYNEASSIKTLLETIIKQKEKGFKIKEIIVVSDGSTDRTVQEVKRVKSRIIEINAYQTRKGKIMRSNEYYKKFAQDILVQFDGDIVLKDMELINKLIQPIITNPSIGICFGMQKPLDPTTYVERLAHFGFCVWEDIKLNLGDRAERYNCFGMIRAFSKKFIAKYRMPGDSNLVLDDVYSFYYAKKHNIPTVYRKNAVAYFRLAATIKDYVKQMSRYLYAADNMSQYFNETLLSKYETINTRMKLKSFFNAAREYPLQIAISYIMLQIFTKFAQKFQKNNTLWAIASSSKHYVNTNKNV